MMMMMKRTPTPLLFFRLLFDKQFAHTRVKNPSNVTFVDVALVKATNSKVTCALTRVNGHSNAVTVAEVFQIPASSDGTTACTRVRGRIDATNVASDLVTATT